MVVRCPIQVKNLAKLIGWRPFLVIRNLYEELDIFSTPETELSAEQVSEFLEKNGFSGWEVNET